MFWVAILNVIALAGILAYVAYRANNPRHRPAAPMPAAPTPVEPPDES